MFADRGKFITRVLGNGKKIIALIAAGFLLFFPRDSLAAAWTLNKGDVQIIHNLLYYKSRYFIDNQGKRHRQGTFSKYNYNPYIEIGLKDDLTFGISPVFTDAEQRGKSGKQALSGTEIFLRQQHYKDKHWVISSQNLVGLPGSYGKEEEELLGKRDLELEFRTLVGYSFQLFEKKHFSDLELAYRYHSGTGGGEVRMDGTVGIRIVEKWQWLAQAFSVYTVGALPDTQDNIANDVNFRLVKVQNSALYEVTDNVSLQMGLTQDVLARNTGRGTGIMTALWVKF